MAQSIGMASSDLTKALSSQLPHSPSHTLGTLLASSIGGQETAAWAMQTSGQGRRWPDLLTRTTHLADVAQSAEANFRAGFTDKIPTEARTAIVLAHQQSPLDVARDDPDQRTTSGIDIPRHTDGYISDLEVRELAARRDAGIIAQAALDGTPEARQLVGDATPRELQNLVRDGDTAKAELVMSADRMGGWVAGRTSAKFSMDRDEAYSLAMLGIARAAERHDPNRGTWATYAIISAEAEIQNSQRRQATYSKHVETAAEHLFEVQPARLPDVDQAHLSAEGVRQIMSAVDSLPREERDVLASFLQRTLRDAPATPRDIAQDIPVSPSTIRRRLRAGRENLREALQQGEQESTDAERLRAIQGALRALGSPAPQTPHGGETARPGPPSIPKQGPALER